MTGLSARALCSRSGIIRRVARPVDEGPLRRTHAHADGRGVVVAPTDAGWPPDRTRAGTPEREVSCGGDGPGLP